MSFTNTVAAGGPAPTSWITLPASPLLQLTGNKSFSFWMRPNTDVPVDGYSEWIYNYDVCGDLLSYSVYNNQLYCQNGCNGNSYTYGYGYSPGAWQHVVITESGGSRCNYLEMEF